MTTHKIEYLWAPYLIRKVTVNMTDFHCLYLMFKASPDRGNQVKSLTILFRELNSKQDELMAAFTSGMEQINPIMALEEFSNYKQDKQNMIMLTSFIYSRDYIFTHLNSLETLYIDDYSYIPNFEAVNRDWTETTNYPMSVFKNSLKRVYICDDRNQRDLETRNVAWMLIFCESLEEAALSCVLSIEDSKYLEEFHTFFKDLSNVKDLAICIQPLKREERASGWDNEKMRRSWFDMKIEDYDYSAWARGNKRTEAVYRLLSVTKELRSLELSWGSTLSHESESLNGVLAESLSSLESSFKTLKVLRLIGVHFPIQRPRGSTFNLSLFESLQVIEFDPAPLWAICLNDYRVLPKSLKKSVLLYHDDRFPVNNIDIGDPPWREEIMIVALIKSNKVEELVLPATPVLSKFKPVRDQKKLEIFWQLRKEAPKDTPELYDGSIKLTLARPRDRREYSILLFVI